MHALILTSSKYLRSVVLLFKVWLFSLIYFKTKEIIYNHLEINSFFSYPGLSISCNHSNQQKWIVRVLSQFLVHSHKRFYFFVTKGLSQNSFHLRSQIISGYIWAFSSILFFFFIKYQINELDHQTRKKIR